MVTGGKSSLIYTRNGKSSALTEDYVVPEGYHYTKDHEWILPRGSTFLVGITDYAVRMLNDVVYVDLPEPGTNFGPGDVFGQVESVKTVSDIFMPVTGRVIRVNSQLTKTPEVVSRSPYNDGWMLEIESSSFASESEKLLNAKAYSDYIKNLEH